MSLSDFQTSYQVSPIVLVNGMAGTGMLPITSILSPSNYQNGIVSASSAGSLSDIFGQFKTLPGHTLMDNEIAHYPLANQTIAANAVITNPLRISLEMLVPAYGSITMANKLSIITALKSALDQHTALGGSYNVSTPSYIYTGCLLTSLVDASDDDEGKQPQVRWIWNFEQPLLTEAAAVAAQNQAMTKLTNQTVDTADPPGSQPATSGIGNPSSNIVQNTVPSASSPAGSNIPATNSTSGTTNLASVSPIMPGS